MIGLFRGSFPLSCAASPSAFAICAVKNEAFSNASFPSNRAQVHQLHQLASLQVSSNKTQNMWYVTSDSSGLDATAER